MTHEHQTTRPQAYAEGWADGFAGGAPQMRTDAEYAAGYANGWQHKPAGAYRAEDAERQRRYQEGLQNVWPRAMTTDDLNDDGDPYAALPLVPWWLIALPSVMVGAIAGALLAAWGVS
jgi:hypothetical protein